DRQRPETSSESRAATSQKLHKTPAQRLKLKLAVRPPLVAADNAQSQEIRIHLRTKILRQMDPS
ncbi:hypothetical protein, partial [Nocardia grenadensis]